MSKEKFTPGPWGPLFVSGVCIGVSTNPFKGMSQIIVNTILPETDQEYMKESAEIEANARLIAAAPEMYALLKDAIGWDNDFDDKIETLLNRINP